MQAENNLIVDYGIALTPLWLPPLIVSNILGYLATIGDDVDRERQLESIQKVYRQQHESVDVTEHIRNHFKNNWMNKKYENSVSNCVCGINCVELIVCGISWVWNQYL